MTTGFYLVVKEGRKEGHQRKKGRKGREGRVSKEGRK
jgi:hypothetical protein